MRDFKLDPETGDLDLSRLDLTLIDGAEQVRQQLYLKLNLWREEWFLDLKFGTPWIEEVLGRSSVTVGAARAAIVKSALEVDGVDEIEEFSYTLSNDVRKLTVSLRAKTRFGIVEVEDVYASN